MEEEELELEVWARVGSLSSRLRRWFGSVAGGRVGGGGGMCVALRKDEEEG